MKTLILCGGKGTRAYPLTVDVPKPLLEVAGRPVLHHVMEIYAMQGFTSFVLAAGFRWTAIRDYARTLPDSWNVEVVDTGEETNTGGRVKMCRDLLSETSFVTYGDGLGNVTLRDLLDRHRAHNGSATLTMVPLPSQYGTLEIGDDGRVIGFTEKPRLRDHWINAGFFVFDDAAFDHWAGEDLERDVLPALTAAGQLYAYPHEGFWKSMDTYKESLEIDAMARSAEDEERRPPWLNFETGASS